jgi:hypothetical protein
VKVSGSLGLGALEPIATERRAAPVADAPNSTVDDSLTFSSEARARAEAAAHPRFGSLSVAAHGDADLADQLAYNYSHDPFQQLVDLTDEIAGTGPMKYAATGEPVTAESEARFKQYASDFQAASRALYNEERARGTSSADIFDKLIALADTQPADFRAMMDWEGLTAKSG